MLSRSLLGTLAKIVSTVLRSKFSRPSPTSYIIQAILYRSDIIIILHSTIETNTDICMKRTYVSISVSKIISFSETVIMLVTIIRSVLVIFFIFLSTSKKHDEPRVYKVKR